MTRTSQQNKSLHLYLNMLSEELQEQGQTLQDVLKEIRKAQVTPTPEALKEAVWKTMQEALYGKRSTTKLTKQEVDKVYMHINAWTTKSFGINLPFPSRELTDNQNNE